MNNKTRITVDPNSNARGKPWLSVASFEDASKIPIIGEEVTIVQPYDDEPNFIGTGKVESINNTHKLIYVEVDWKSFHDEIV